MTFTQFLTESARIFTMIHDIMSSVPDIIITVIFTIVAFSVVLALLDMVRGLRS